MYIKSAVTGQCYKVEYIPQYGGYEVITQAEFEDWCRAHGI